MKMIPKSMWPWLNVLVPVALCSLLMTLRVADPGQVFEKLTLSILDGYQSLEVESSASDEAKPVRLLQIDDEALEAFGQWPWSRDKLGEILITLYEKGATVVGIDLLLAEPDRLSPARFLSKFPNLTIETEQFANAFGYIDNDQFLSDVFSQTPSVLAVAASHKVGGDVDAAIGFAWVGASPDGLLAYNGLLAPTEILKQSGVKVGHIAVRPDADGMLRRIPLLIRAGDLVYPSLFLSMLANEQEASTIIIKGSGGDDSMIETVKVGAYEIPVDSDGEMQVVPHHIVKSFPGLHLTEVLDGLHDEKIAGSVILLGPTATGLMDFHDTPAGLNVPGPALHVAALKQIYAEEYVIRDAVVLGAEWFGALLLSIICIVVALKCGGLVSPAIFVVLIGSYIGSGFWWFSESGHLFDWSLGTMFGLTAFVSSTAVSLLRTESEKGQIRKAFSTYLSPDLVAEISKNPDKLKLGGERREVTVLFADIRGFTTMSEGYKDKPEELTVLLNDLLTPLTYEIMDHKGTIDKYMGDAIMAFWNAPVDVPNHPRIACEVAIGMMIALEVLNKELISSGRIAEPLKIGIGLNTGEVTVGNLGSEQRFDYSCLGDAINLGARLEGLSKAYGVPIVIGEATYDVLDRPPAGAEVVLLDHVIVKGKSIAVAIYGIIPEQGFPTGWCADHNQFMDHVSDENWKEAEVLLGALQDRDDYPAELLEQCAYRVEQKSSAVRQMHIK
ncbi:MAG: adenylate/guanylate cyclase domain-containing protein [Proteobacteria bacterium]|nr:adenylate/guanylate cyclase domain-containing protein [Pseudomonadota bacterium]MDA1012044.1 adenylate/guanylate cyclase domain-containing protein [Pseudomonadota bacterium]